MDVHAMLTDEQKRNILTQRVQQFAAEAYQHTLNREVALRVGDTQAVALADAALATLDAAMAVHAEQLGKLPPSPPPPQL